MAFVVFFSAGFLGFSNLSFAAGDAVKCVVTIKKVLLKKVSGDWIPVPDSAREADLSKEEPVLSFINYNKVPSGKYVNFKIVLSETVKVAGKDGKNLTKEGGEITVGGTAVSASELPGNITSFKVASPVWNTRDSGLITEHLNLDYEDRNDTMEIYPRRNFQPPFIVKQGSGVTLWMTMNLERTIYFAFPNSISKNVPKENVMYFIPPKEIEDVSITVDAVSSFASSDEIAFDF